MSRWTIDQVEYLLNDAIKQRLASLIPAPARRKTTRKRNRGGISAHLPAEVAPSIEPAPVVVEPETHIEHESIDPPAPIVEAPATRTAEPIVEPKRPVRQVMTAAARLGVIQRVQRSGVVLYDEGG